jgi:Acetyltransferases
MNPPAPLLAQPDVRWAGAADADVLAGILVASWLEAWSAEALRTLLHTPGIFGILAERDGGVPGFVLGRVAADEAEILTLAVLPAARRRGYGRALLQEAMGVAQFWGAAHLFLEVGDGNMPARALYTAAGLEIIGRRRGYYRIAGAATTDALILRAALRPGS